MSEDRDSKFVIRNSGGDTPAQSHVRSTEYRITNHESPSSMAWRRFRGNRAAMMSAIILAALVIAAVLLPWLKHDSLDAISDAQFQSPSADHIFGTDVHGRDLFVRVFYGTRISLVVGIVTGAMSLVVGVLWGAVAGYKGGRTDAAMMRFVDILFTLPYLLFVIVLITTLEEPLKNLLQNSGLGAWTGQSRLLLLFVGLGAVSWLTMSRIVRGQILSLKNQTFVEASRAQGASTQRIILHHLLPNTYGIVIVYLTLTIPGIMLMESFLSFLGLGVQPPQASLGSLLADGAAAINPIKIYWWLIVFPGATMALTLLALNFLGDGLRDALDPRTRK